MNINEWFEALQHGKFKLGDRVRKKSGSEWQGHVCGFYVNLPLTPIGYNVESECHKNSVQIYPEGALELVPEEGE